MNKLRLLGVAALALFVLVMPAIASAQSAPGIPNRFYGTARGADGLLVAAGTTISGVVDAAVVATTTATAGGNYTLDVVQPSGANYAGKTVSFRIGTATAAQTAVWTFGDLDNLNLTVGSAAGAGITLTPSTGIVTNMLGVGFTPNSAVTITAGTTTLTVVTTDGGGSFRTTVAAPSTTPGAVVLTARQGTTTATATLTVPAIAGAAGPQGPVGFTGLPGRDGTNGAAGAAGPQGPAGVAGAAGPAGAKGAAGAQGPAGPAGASSSKGVAIVALIIAIVALVGAGAAMMMKSKPKK